MTTTTVSLDGLRELAGFRAQNGCAISLYVDLDPTISPTTRETAIRVHAMLDSAAKSHGATRPDLAHEVKSGLKADFERLAQYFDEEFDRDGAHGLAVFAGRSRQHLERARAAVEGGRRGQGRRRLSAQPAGAADRPRQRGCRRRRRAGAGACPALRGGRFQQIADRTEETQGRHDQGGWSQSRYQRHIANLDLEHYKTVADELERVFRALGRPRIIVVAGDETRAEFADVLSSELEEAVIGWTSADAHASDGELGEIVQPFVDEWCAGLENDAVARWREEVGKNALGSPAGRTRSRLRPTVVWSCCSIRRASSGTRTAAAAAAAPPRRASPARSTGRRWSTATTARPRVRLTLAYGGDLSRRRTPGSRSRRGIGAILRF
jgi:hypothetical protein